MFKVKVTMQPDVVVWSLLQWYKQYFLTSNLSLECWFKCNYNPGIK